MSADQPKRRAITVEDILKKVKGDAADRAAGRLPLAKSNQSVSNEKTNITLKDFQRSSAAAEAMTKHRASLPPSVVHMLRVLTDRNAFPADHVKWVEDGARSILARWDRSEDPAQLRADLGLIGPKRRKERTAQRETMIAAAVADAALAGSADPRKTAREKLKIAAKDVRLAWAAWAPVYVARLFEMKSKASAKERVTIRRAITVLEGIRKNKK